MEKLQESIGDDANEDNKLEELKKAGSDGV